MAKETVVVDGGQGKADPNYYLDSAGGAFSDKTHTKFADVARILDVAAAQAPPNGLILHFHGGLNSRDYALTDIVPRLTKRYKGAHAYPLFFVWQSGFKETLVNNREQLLKDPTFRELVKKVAEWTLKKATVYGNVVVRGTGGALESGTEDAFRAQFDAYFDGDPLQPRPPVPDEQAPAGSDSPVVRTTNPNELELQKAIAAQLEGGFDPAFVQAMRAAHDGWIPGDGVSPEESPGAGTSQGAREVLLSEAAINEMFPPTPGAVERGLFTWIGVARYVAKIILAVIARFREHRDHGVYCTVVEEVLRSAFVDLLGSNVWNQMKDDTLDSFNSGEFCGTAVVEKLKALQDGGNGFKKLTLVGHSTGAIYICNFLDAAKAAGLAFDKVQVVFLAPAVTCSRFAQAIESHGAGYLAHFRMFAMRDERESQDKLVPVLYTRSLLYFVSGLLEGKVANGRWQGILDMPLVGMERFFKDAHQGAFGADPDIRTVRKFLEAPGRTIWSPSVGAQEGFNSDSATHGDFDNDEVTLNSVVNVIAS